MTLFYVRVIKVTSRYLPFYQQHIVFRECVYDYLLNINLVIRAFVNGYTRKYILLKRAKNFSGFLSPSSLLARRFCRHFLIYSCSSWYSRRHLFNYSLSIWMAVS